MYGLGYLFGRLWVKLAFLQLYTEKKKMQEESNVFSTLSNLSLEALSWHKIVSENY